MANDITNKMYGTGEGVVQQVVGYVPIPAKITSIGANDPDPLVDAFNIDWASGQYSYDGNPEHIIQSTGHLIEVINSKSTASGEVWDNIKGSNYITSQLTIYATNNVKTPPECDFSGEPIDIDNYDKQVYANLPEGWVESLDNVESNYYVFQTSVYEVRTLNNEIKGYHEPISDVIYLIGENGINGNFKSTVFCRTNETPVAPKQGAYYNTGLPSDTNVYNNSDYANNNIISNAEWSDGIPNGQEILWASTAIISDNSGSIDGTATWTTPRQMTDTATYDVEFSPNDTKPAIPSNDKTKREGQGWYDPNTKTQVNWETMIWRAERECINGEWKNWIIVRIKGEQGTAGVKGDFKSTVFTRSEDKPNRPSDNDPNCDYDHPVPENWSDGIPNGTGPVWSTWRTFSINGNNSSWTEPTLVADTPTYDVEFSPYSNNNNTGPRTTTNIDTSDDWFDPTADITLPNDLTWEKMIWRAERNRATTQDEWSAWVITKIKGEDGTIPKPLDFYQTRYAKISKTSLDANDKLTNQTGEGPSSEYIESSGHIKWYKYVPSSGTGNVWQTMRRVTWQQDNNTWFELYDTSSTWEEPFMLNGLPGEAQPIHPCLLYKWDLDPRGSNNTPYTPSVNRETDSIPDNWSESPNNPTPTDIDAGKIFLWMIQSEYKITNGNTREYQKIEGENYWTTPICLSGADGKPGEDGDDIEFIYKSFQNATSFDGTTDDSPQHWYTTNIEVDYAGTGSNAKAKPDYLGPAGKEWSDNASAQVVSPSQKYVYCSYRRSVKSGNTRYWTPFSPPFPWSIWGENGIDGDGVEYIYYVTNSSTFDAPNFNPSNWQTDGTTLGKNGKKFQDDDYLGPNGSEWTDEPTGVGPEPKKKYEFISIRKKVLKTGSTTEKEWGAFSEPKLWSNYAEDGLAVNMVLETDNDNITVGIDENGLVNGKYTDIANVYLKYNGIPKTNYNLTLSINNESTLDGNLQKYNNDTEIRWKDSTNAWKSIVVINNSTKTISIDIPQGMPIGQLNNILSIQLTATTNAQIDDIDTGTIFTKIFKITGVRLSIKDIYKLNLSTTTPHRNVNNDGFEPVTLRLKSYTSEASISDVETAKAKGLFVICNSTSKNTGDVVNREWIVSNFENIDLPADFNKHTFTLYFKSSVNSNTTLNNDNISNLKTDAIWLDEEELCAVYDGNNGVDSRSEEYIYLLTDDIDFLTNHSSNNNYYVPSSWTTFRNYQENDYPFDNESPTTSDGISYIKTINSNNGEGSIDTTNDLVIAYWTDNPQGVSEQYPYEFRAARRYDTTQDEGSRWQVFEKPICWANWGHTGEDGDGVEYIYYRSDSAYSSWVENEHPTNWFNRTGEYQSSEYIHSNAASIWKDNPQGVTSSNKYEYISIRKYKKLSYKDWNNFALTCKTIGGGVSLASHLNSTNTNIPITFTSDEQFYTLRGNIETLLHQYVLHVNTWQLNCCEGSLEILNAIISSITDNKKYWSPYSNPSIWAKYGEKGATGSPGGSGLTFDFDNPSMQIAVNSNGRIKDNQEVITYLNVYEGASKIPANNITLSIISNGTHDAFEHQYNDANAYGYTLFNSNSDNEGTSTYYTWKIGDVDTTNIGDNNIVKLTENSSIEFNIKYGDNNYVKHVSLVPIQYGEDGADAVVFDLYCPTSVIHYNAMDDTPTFNPNTISDIKVRKIENSNVEYKITEGNNGNDNGFAISYYMEFPLSTSQATGGNEGTIGGGEIRPMSLPQKLTKNISGYIYNETLDINDKINNALNDDKNYDIPKTVKLSLYHTENDTTSLWDETDLEIIYDGINGTDSFAEEFIYSITYVPNDNSGGEDPSTWAIKDSRDYIPDNQTSYWKDHPQGISLEHPIEWMSHRTYDYVNKTWNKYEAPVEWSHYGEKGLDGDGVEYIFAVGYSSDWKTAIGYDNDNIARDPRIWWNYTENSDYQKNSEFINSTVDNIWKDNPQTNLQDGQYQFVSIRKYRIFTEHDKNAIKYHNGILGDYDTNSAPYDINNDTLDSLIGKKMWMPYSEPTIWSSNIPGQPGQDGADAYVLDWTNDQINLAVDENGIILPNQNKSTTLTLLTNDSTLDIDNVAHNFGNIFNAGRSFRSGTTTSSKNYSFSIQIADDYVYDAESTSKNVLPENGKEIEFTITLSDGTILYKSLRICGQHNGQNAVTYEIVPSVNTVKKLTNGSCQPANISYTVYKYNGTNISEVTNFAAETLKAEWTHLGAGAPISIGYNNSISTNLINGYAYVDLNLWHGSGTSAKVIDRETIPIIDQGEKGAQGFTGAIVRMRGEWTSNAYYGNGKYNSNYDGTSILYKDIVVYNNKYWTPKDSLTTYLSANNTNSGLCKGSAYAYGTIPSTAATSKWIAATQYDFIATKLLYADQALINQISSHDFIATTEDGTPVAGMTSGKKEYGKDNERLTLLNNANGGDIDTGGVTGTSSDTLADTSHVRMFAGQIWKNNGSTTSYSLTYAPFNVRQDGTAYMSKANIVGDVNIGGQVNIAGNVNIEGNAKVKADVSVNTLTLNSGSFIINSDCNLPNFNVNEHKMFYVLIHKQDNNICYINPQNNQSILATDTNGNFKNYDPGTSIELQNHGLYTAISTYMNDMSYWIVSKTGVYAVPNARQTYRKIFSKNDIASNQFIYISKIEIEEKKVIKCTFKTNSPTAPSSGKAGFTNVQSVFVYCSLNDNSYYQVGIRVNDNWIYNSLTPEEIIPSRTDDDTSFNISHHYTSGSNIANGWNNGYEIDVELTWNDPTEQESGYDGLSVNDYRILYYHDTHGWRHNINNVQQDAISGGTYPSSQQDKFNYYVEIVYYN